MKLGNYAAILTSAVAVLTFVVAFLTPPLSGPGCTGSCFEYPYIDIAGRFPRDYYWMYLAILWTLVFFVLVASIHHAAPPEKKVFSQIGMSFALVSVAVLVSDYFIQLSVIQPSLVKGETDGISLLTQFNSHGVFIALEEVGFTMMSLSLLFLAPVFSDPNRLEKAIRWIFIAGFVLAMIALGIFSLQFGIFREYFYEIAVISINWIALIISGILLSAFFRRALRTAP
jgi:hypothetical protein